jgi:hypothetical protein
VTRFFAFLKPSRGENKRLRDLEQLVLDLSEDVTKCLERTARIDARLRQRASRAARDGDAEESEPSASPSHPAPSTPLPASPEGAPSQPYSKDQLRQLARARGFLPH